MFPLDFEQYFANKRILITGHAGFTGTWARLWLDEIGAETYGLGFENEERFSMHKFLNRNNSRVYVGDVADSSFVFQAFESIHPELVLHLAAQPIVSEAYLDPFRTITSNIQGTAVILEACKRYDSVESIVCVTTDKVYKNRESGKRFVEGDELGGGDPYSASKSGAEHVIAAYAQALTQSSRKVNVNVARGGNILGGGDYSKNRIIPDLVRAILQDDPFHLRQPFATRPWQHVLSLIHGYLLLLSRENLTEGTQYDVWNFGPRIDEARTVMEIVELFGKHWKLPDIGQQIEAFPESKLLSLDSSKSQALLNWRPAWDFEQIIEETATWYREVHQEESTAMPITLKQISSYRKSLQR